MAPTLRTGFDSASGITGPTPIDLAAPSSLALNDLILVAVVCGTSAVPTPPEGFFPVPGAGVTGVSACIRVFQKIATSSEPSTYRVMAPDGIVFSACICACHPTSLTYAYAQAVKASSSSVSSTNKVWPSVTTVDANELLLCFGGFATSGGSTPDALMTERVDATSSSARIYLMTQTVVAAGATGTRTATGTSASLIRTVTIAISESNDDPTPLPRWGIWPDTGSLTVYGKQRSISNSVTDTRTAPNTTIKKSWTLIAPPPNTKSMGLRNSWTIYNHKSGGILNDAGDMGAGKPAATLTQTGGISTEVFPADGTTTGSEEMSYSFPGSASGDWPVNSDTIVSSPPAAHDDAAFIQAEVLVSCSSGQTATATIDWTTEVTWLEFDDGTFWYPTGVAVTALPVLAEMEGSGVEVTEAAVLVEVSAVGVYTTAVPVIVEVGAVGVYTTAVPVLIELEFQEPEPEMATVTITNQGTRRMHTALPDEVTGYAFDPFFSWWAAVVAEESTNLLLNPSFEAWNDVGNVVEYNAAGDITLAWVQFPDVGATAGRRCARLTGGANTGWLYTDQTLHITPGAYTWACDVYVARVPYTLVLLAVTDSGATQLGRRQYNVTSTGWQRLSLTFVNAGSADVELRLILLNTNPSGVVVYTDAWQFEAKPYPTTYLDGDMIGFNDTSPQQSYFWHGEPHRSVSTRRARTGSGGRIVSWSQEARFRTTSIIGLGMTTVEQKTQVLGDGREVHLSLLDKARDFTVTGRIFAANPRELRRRSNDLIKLLKGNNTPGGDQMILRFQEVDDAGHLVGAALDITCVYKDGLQGNMTNFYQTNLPLQFHAVQPYPADTIESSVQLDLAKTISSAGIFYRDEEGEFHDLSHGGVVLDGVIQSVGFLLDGTMVALGNFTSIGGDVADGAAYWDGSNWVQLGTTPPGSYEDVDDGYRLGYPLTIASVDGNVHEYDALFNTWGTLGSHGFNAAIFSLQRDMNGDVWVGGFFDFADDDTTKFHRVARYNAATGDWEQLGGGVSDPNDFFPGDTAVYAVLATNDGSVYFGGNFGQADANYDPIPPTVLAKGVARWDIASETWNRVGTGLGGTVQHLLRGPDGYIYAIGTFATDAGLNPYPLRGFARFNGENWEEVFPLVNVDGDYGADGATIDDDGIFWFWNNVSDPDHDYFVVPGLGNVGNFGWRDGIFYPSPVPDAGLEDMATGPAGIAIWSAHSMLGGSTMYVPFLNRVEYGGSADAPMVLHLHGGSQFFHFLNLSTEGGLYGKGDFLISANEEVIVRTDSQRSMVYSNQRANITSQVSVGASNMKALRLVPGENRISTLITHPDGNEEGWLTWKNRYASLMEGIQ